VLTGVLSEGDQGAKPSEEWTIDELKAAKPLFVYRFVDQLTDASDENYQFSQAFEIKILAKDEVIKQINDGWRAKRSPIDIEADRKKDENQAGIAFYSYTGQKMGSLSLSSRMSTRNFITTLSKYEKENRKICDKEIKRLEELAKAMEEALGVK
jgi:hypothetical protein